MPVGSLDPKRTVMGLMPPGAPAAPQPAPVKPSFDPKHTMLGTGGPAPQAPAPAWHAPEQQQPPAPVQPAFNPKHTMLGVAPAAVPAAAPARMDPKRTMLGMPSEQLGPARQPAVQDPGATRVGAPAPQPASAANATMLGVPLPQPQHTPPQKHPQQPIPGGPLDAKHTLLGVAVPGIAPTHAAPGAPGPQHGPSANATMLGVAVPGIAPVHPGAPLRPEPVPDYPEPAAPKKRPRKRVVLAHVPVYRRPAVVLSVLAGVVAIFGISVALLWKGPAPIRSEARIDAKGQDYLHITCASCPDGTTLSIGDTKANVAQGAAELPLATALAVGENRFQVHIDRPAGRRDEDVKLIVPIAYRLRPDLSALHASPPAVHILVEAAPDTKVVIDGQPLKLGADGKGSHAVELSAECTGPAAEQRTVDRNIAYEVTPKGAGTDKGTVSVKVGIAPLVLDAPRPHAVTDATNVEVAGRTLKGTMVELEGVAVNAGADGSFSRKVRVDKPGEAEVRVRALGRDQAARTIVVKLKRVTDLAAEGRAFAAQATLDLTSLMAEPKAHAGKPVVLTGEVVESRAQGPQTIVLLDATEGCKKRPCLVRVVVAGVAAAAKGDSARVFGHVTGLYEARGAPAVPEVDAAFVLRGGKP
jgi:hypothetical protein